MQLQERGKQQSVQQRLQREYKRSKQSLLPLLLLLPGPIARSSPSSSSCRARLGTSKKKRLGTSETLKEDCDAARRANCVCPTCVKHPYG